GIAQTQGVRRPHCNWSQTLFYLPRQCFAAGRSNCLTLPMNSDPVSISLAPLVSCMDPGKSGEAAARKLHQTGAGEPTQTPSPNMNQRKAVGIDLGTTFSAVAHIDAYGKPQIIPNTESKRMPPSVMLSDWT